MNTEQNDKHKPKLLLIDDEAEFASTLRRRLQLRNFDVEDAHSGGEGLAVFPEVQPDIVILDLKMADMNGLTVLEKIKEYDPAVEVFMLTGHGSVSAGVEARNRGGFDYIIKRVDLEDLLETIREATEKQQQG